MQLNLCAEEKHELSLQATHFNLFELLISDITDVGDVTAVARSKNYKQQAEEYHKRQ